MNYQNNIRIRFIFWFCFAAAIALGVSPAINALQAKENFRRPLWNLQFRAARAKANQAAAKPLAAKTNTVSKPKAKEKSQTRRAGC